MQLPKRIKRTERDQVEAHQVCLAERQFLKHVAGDGRVGHVQDKNDAASILQQGNRISKLSQDPSQEGVAPGGSPEFFGQ